MEVPEMEKRVLVVDDEKLIRWSLEKKISSWGYSVETSEDVKSTYEKLENYIPDLILLDIKLPDGNGIEILKKIRSLSKDVAVIMITAEGTVTTAVQAMKLGAYDYIAKPFNLEEMKVLIEKALEKTELIRDLDYYKANKLVNHANELLIGESKPFREIIELVKKIATSPSSTILLLGESGTGKNVLAKTIHYSSDRSDKPFVTVESTAIPSNLLESELFGHEKGAFTDAHNAKKGLFELARNGTIFFDEIGDLSTDMQAKLLRVIDEKRFRRVGGITDQEVNVRIIAASNINIELEVKERRFRQDLYYRLNVIPINLPPLREREQDVILIAEHFMKMYSHRFNKTYTSIGTDAKRVLLDHTWPGNVRELRNTIERAILLESGPELKREYLQFDSHQMMHEEETIETAPFIENGMTMDEVEAAMIQQALQKAKGNQTQAADILGISRDVLRYRMKKYNIAH
jgi:two-component system, NtrC family, response regulator AtoC